MVKTGLEDPNSAAAIRRRMNNCFEVSYQTQVGRKLQDDGMRTHYERVMSQSHEVDDSGPSESHYLHLDSWKKNPSFKKSATDQHVFNMVEMYRIAGMAKTLPQTDSSAPLVMYSNKAARDKYRRRVQQLPGYRASAAYEIQWSSHEEQHALNHLNRHSRAVNLQHGWTDHGPPIAAMAYRKFRRAFKKAAILDMPPPPGMYLSAYEKNLMPKQKFSPARSHTSREERSIMLRAQTSQEKRRTAHKAHLNHEGHVDISNALRDDNSQGGEEPLAIVDQGLLPKRRLGTAHPWVRTTKVSTAKPSGCSDSQLAEASVKASSDVVIQNDVDVFGESPSIALDTYEGGSHEED